MIRFLRFIKKIYVVLLFILLQAFAIHFYANSTSYTKAKMLSASNTVVGGFYGFFSGVGSYFALRGHNDILIDEVSRLRNELAFFQENPALATPLPEGELPPHEYMTARVVNNSISRQENYITLNRGLRDGVEADMAILTPNGKVAGYVLARSDKYAVGISVLNTEFRTSGRIKGADFFGSVYWDGLDHRHVVLSEIPKYASLNRGDTVVTTDYSAIFPADMMIGTVESWELRNSTYYEVRLKLAAQMSTLKEVLLTRFTDAAERTALEQETQALSRR